MRKSRPRRSNQRMTGGTMYRVAIIVITAFTERTPRTECIRPRDWKMSPERAQIGGTSRSLTIAPRVRPQNEHAGPVLLRLVRELLVDLIRLEGPITPRLLLLQPHRNPEARADAVGAPRG